MALTDGLLTYYSLDDADLSGSDPDDLSGNGNDGTTSGSVNTGVTGKINEGFDFPGGASDYVDTNTTFTSETEFSVNMWINADSATGNKLLFGQLDNTGPGITFLYLQYLSTQKVRWGVLTDDSTNVTIDSLTSVTVVGGWWMITATFKSGGNTIIYINGSNDNSAAHSGDAVSNTSPIFPLGAGYQGGIILPFNGQIDEFGMWNRELTSAEVTELYNSGSGFRPDFGNGAKSLNFGGGL